MLANSSRTGFGDRDECLWDFATEAFLDCDKARLFEFDQVCGEIAFCESR
jgi:hypothetical protein